MLGIDDLIDLIDELRLAGYQIGTQQYIYAQDLLLALEANQQLPASPVELRTFLAPILCSSPKEQAHFYQHYDQWLERHPHLRTTREQIGSHEFPPKPISRLTKARRIVLGHRFLIACAAILLAGSAGAALYVQLVPRGLSGRVIDAEDKSPVSGAQIQFANQIVFSDDSGNFSLTYQRRNADPALHISHQGYTSTKQDHSAPLFRTTEPLGEIALFKSQKPPSEVDAEEVLGIAQPTSIFQLSRTQLQLFVVTLPLIVFATWWLWGKYRQRTLLQKMSTAREPQLKRLRVKGAATQLYRGQAIRRIAQELRRHRQRASRDLDAQLTVEATVARAGLLVPIYASRKTLPEYLALVDRASLRDQQARLNGELINRLSEDNVFVDRYYYNEDARTCRSDNRPVSFHTLHNLSSRHPDHHLVIFGDGSGLLDPLTGQPQLWLKTFSAWLERALVTPESPAHWSYREWVLSELGFAVLPSGAQGLAALAEVINTGGVPKPQSDSTALFPELLRENPRRWLEGHEARPLDSKRLCKQLQDYLGESGFHWLCACAAYPMLSWDLTVYFGYKILNECDSLETKLSALVRLPWFRYGEMPDWLRIRFLSDMSATAENALRRMLEDLLISSLQDPSGGMVLEIAMRPQEAAERGWRSFPRALAARLRQKRKHAILRQLLRVLPEEDRLRDHVFLTFLSGGRLRKLDVSVPQILRRVLYPQGQPSIGLRTATAFTLAITTSIAGWSVLSAWQPETKPDTQKSRTGEALPTPSKADVYITEIYMAKDDNGDPGEPTTNYNPGDHMIHCVVELNTAREGTQLKFVWHTIDVIGRPGSEVIKSIEYATKARENIVHGHLNYPEDWPKGTYKVDVYVNGVLDKTMNYKME